MNILDIGRHLTNEELMDHNPSFEEMERIPRHLERCLSCRLRRDQLRRAETRRMIAENEEMLRRALRNK